jgi:hypothetical protein
VTEIPYESSASPQHVELPPAPPALASVPRPVTPRAARRSWSELPVRIWVVLAVAVAMITAYFTITKYFAGRYERWLITQGAALEADVMWINGSKRPGDEFKRTDRLQAQLGYTPPGGQRMDYVEGWLAQLPDQKPVPLIRVGDKIKIRIDPAAPRTWTDRTQPKSWLAEFTIVVLLLPLLAVLGLIAWVRRRQVLGVWRSGEIAAGVVVDLRQTAVAPLSRLVRFTLAEGDDRRVCSALHPAQNVPQAGDVIWLIMPPRTPSRAVIASLYE